MKFDRLIITERLRNPRISALIGMTVGVAAGASASYIFTSKREKAKYEKLLDLEIEKAKDRYKRTYKTGEYADPTLLKPVEDKGEVEQIIQGYTSPPNDIREEEPDMEETEEEEVVNIFTVTDDQELEEPRDRSKPYIISNEEFMTNEDEYDQTTVTYFEQDDILADEHDSPIDHIEMTVGEENMTRFGFMSKDNNVVYVRNDKLELDFEILRSKGSYAKEVLGYIEHSDKPGKVRKFRTSDDW